MQKLYQRLHIFESEAWQVKYKWWHRSKYGNATDQMWNIYAFSDIVLMPTYQRMKDSKWILKRRRASSSDIVLESKNIDSSIQKYSRDVIFNESASIGEQGREGVGINPQLNLKTSAVMMIMMMMTIHKKPQDHEYYQGLEKFQISLVNGFTLLTD